MTDLRSSESCGRRSWRTFWKKGGIIAYCPLKLISALDAKFNVEYDSVIKLDLIQWYDQFTVFRLFIGKIRASTKLQQMSLELKWKSKLNSKLICRSFVEALIFAMNSRNTVNRSYHWIRSSFMVESYSKLNSASNALINFSGQHAMLPPFLQKVRFLAKL